MKPRAPDPNCKHLQFDYADLLADEDDMFTDWDEYHASKMVGYRAASDVPGWYKLASQLEDSDKHTTHGSRRRRSCPATPSASLTSSSAAR